ncbi:MAG: hypothetical protein QOG30_679, partial [Acidimicrobiaceae bacterium]
MASDSDRVRLIASRTRSLGGGGTNSPFEQGASLMGNPGSMSSHRAMREGTSMDIDQAVAFMRSNHQAVLHTFRKDGSPQLSPITVGVDGDGHPVISSRETAFKVKNLVRDPRATLCVLNQQFYGEWAYVD